ncbi:MAG TPA: hypothetical protein DIC42_00180 [Holosporales bacterium]|nr:hypothetical protein [Holosporales bacterium]
MALAPKVNSLNIIINKKNQQYYKQNKGFTLVELSIVLVIIGLIMGGIMTGKDLIQAATIRSQIAQIQGYSTAIKSFKDKYGKLPGDIYPSIATGFGFVTRSGLNNHGDGDGKITGGCDSQNKIGCENALFWRDLSEAKMIKEIFNTAIDDFVTAPAGTVGDYIPEAKLKGNFFNISYYPIGPNLTDGGRVGNIMRILGMKSIATGVTTFSSMLTPQNTMNIDTKMDDGKPLSGEMFINPWTVPAAPAVGVCASSDTGTPYNTSTPAYAGSAACDLWVKF